MNTANSQYISLKMNRDFIGKCSTTAFLYGQIGKLRTFNVYAKLRACLNIRQIARYPPHKIRKTSSKTIRKINLSKI